MAKTVTRRRGDRSDGRLIHSLSAFDKLTPYLVKNRSESQICYDESFEVSVADKFLRKTRINGYKGMSFLHFFIAAYVRCLSMLPGVNRFVSGRKIYVRNSIDIIIPIRFDTGNSCIKVSFEPTDTIYDVYRKINDKTDEIRSNDTSNILDDYSDTLARLPRFIVRLAVTLLNILDYFGLLPNALLDTSPFHGSLKVVDTSALKVSRVSHALHNFGNLPVFVSLGSKHHKYELNRHGKMEDNKYIDCKFVIDERTVDSHYYSQFLQALRYIFQHPEIVELPPSRVLDDIN